MTHLQLAILILAPCLVYYAGYRHGWYNRGRKHWRTFNRLMGEIRG